jgi:hypothetical protein
MLPKRCTVKLLEYSIASHRLFIAYFNILYSYTIDWEPYRHVTNLGTQVNGKDGQRWSTSLRAIT